MDQNVCHAGPRTSVVSMPTRLFPLAPQYAMKDSSHPLRLDRRTVLQSLSAGVFAAGYLGFAGASPAVAGAVRVLPDGKLPSDDRLGELKDLNGYFPFTPRSSPEQWQQRKEEVR